VLFKNNEVRKAIAYIKRAIKFGGDKNAEILSHYGDMMMKKGKRRRAMEIWKEALPYGNEVLKQNLEEKIGRLQ